MSDIVSPSLCPLAKDISGCITTLGRSGSDYSAAIVGAAAHSKRIEIWTDVDGILTADPRLVANPISIRTLTFEQASELAYFGAKVLHPQTMHPAMVRDIPVVVKNTYNPKHPGTMVTNSSTPASLRPVSMSPSLGSPKDYLIVALSIKRNITVVDVVSTRMLGATGFLSKMFKIFDDHKLSVDVIATSEVSVSLSLDKCLCLRHTLDLLKDALDHIASTQIHENKCIVSIVATPSNATEILATASYTLKKMGVSVEMVSYGASKSNITIVINDDEGPGAIRELHDAFFYT